MTSPAEAKRALDEAFAQPTEVPIPADTSSRKKRTATKPPLPPWREGAIAGWCENVYLVAAEMVKPWDEPFGVALGSIAEPAGKTWEKLAKQNISIRRWFARLMQGSAVTELLIVHLPVIMIGVAKINPMRVKVEEMADEFHKEFREVIRDNPTAA